jgi:hypothetical protein
VNVLGSIWKASERVGLVPTVLASLAWLVVGSLGAKTLPILLIRIPLLANASLGLIAIAPVRRHRGYRGRNANLGGSNKNQAGKG